MRRSHLIPVAIIVLAACTAPDSATSPVMQEPGFAKGGGGSPHFIRNATDATLVGSSLVVTFKEAGLAAGSIETVLVSAFATATYFCQNNGGNVPSDPKKTVVSGTVTTSGQFTADQSGNIIGVLTLNPPAPPSSFSCPPGQQVVGPTNVSYSNVVVTDLTLGPSITISGTF
ncbi:MAG TPA: hypothetical protein VLE53_01395 [Gemmatimonadaceae bacterium]|nr:hypothetical protein [Gemmatimonadaceae bacterium]